MDVVLVAFLLMFVPIGGIIFCGLILKKKELAANRAATLGLISVARGGRIRRMRR